MKNKIAVAFVFSAFLAIPAFASDVRCEAQMKIQAAVEIARANGISVVTSAECDDARWEVEGRNAQNQRIEVHIAPNDGRVLGVRRDD